MDCAQRTAAFQSVARTQPGKGPYEHTRPLNINQRTEGQSLESLLSGIRPFSESPELLDERLNLGWIQVDGKAPVLNQILVAGNTITLREPNTTEPTISAELNVLHEDASILVVSKPSPLPVHPCGRFNRNSIIEIAKIAWPDVALKPVHRLDANTTGVLVFAKTSQAARHMMHQFQERTVHKTYAVRVHGHPPQKNFQVTRPIEKAPSEAGTREMTETGRDAVTDFVVNQCLDDGTALLSAHPLTGRTNQIRLHAMAAGYPILGDPAYGEIRHLEEGLTQQDTPLYLHAFQLEFEHPETAQRTSYTVNPPEWFQAPLMYVP